jgi:hypothetical protein
MIITIDTEKSLDKIQHPFIIKKILTHEVKKGMFLNTIRPHMTSPQLTSILSSERKAGFSLKIKGAHS